MSVFKGHQLAKLKEALGDTNQSGIIAKDLVETGNIANASEQTLASVTVTAEQIQRGIKLSAWGSFLNDSNIKTIRLKLGNITVATNDITTKPNNLTYELEAKIFGQTSTYNIIGGGIIGAVVQSRIISQPALLGSQSVTISLTAIASAAIVDSVVSNGLIAESL